MKVKDRVWRPSPHISNLSVEVMAFLQKAAGAFSRPPDGGEESEKGPSFQEIGDGEGGGLAFPRAEGAVDVVEAANPALDAEVLGVVLAELFAGELLQAVGVLGLRQLRGEGDGQ